MKTRRRRTRRAHEARTLSKGEETMSQKTSEINRQLTGMLQARLEFAGISTTQVMDLMARAKLTATAAALRLLENAARKEERAS